MAAADAVALGAFIVPKAESDPAIVVIGVAGVLGIFRSRRHTCASVAEVQVPLRNPHLSPPWSLVRA